MTERATVLSVEEGIATVRCAPTETCSSCSSLLCSPRERTYRAEMEPDAPLDGIAPGDAVEVAVSESGTVGKALLLFGMPIVLFAVAYLATGSLGSEAYRVAAGFVGLAGGFVAAMPISRRFADPLPRIVRVYRDPAVGPAIVPSPGSSSVR